MDLTNIHHIKQFLIGHNLWAKKFLGQNFLINRDILDNIVNTANVTDQDLVIEIGPGLGVLTEQLVQKAKKVISIELDQKLYTLLTENFKNYKNLEIIHQDALRFEPPAETYKVVANIPYNITSPIINHFLQAKNRPTSLTLLVQKEVAQKLCTLEPDMTVLALQVALFGKAKLVKKVSNQCFFPVPGVDSAIIHIECYDQRDPNYIPQEAALNILKLAKQAFSQKRKKLSNTLPDHKDSLTKSGIDPNRRPETLSVQEWLSVANQL